MAGRVGARTPGSPGGKDHAPPLKPKRRRSRRRPRREGRRWLAWAGRVVEAGALLAAALIAEVALLGACVIGLGRASGAPRLLPFVGAVLVLGVLTAAWLRLWFHLHRWLRQFGILWPAVAALIPASGALWYAQSPGFTRAAISLRTLVGGSAEAERVAIEHQVYAAYRRTDLGQMLRVLERARVYEPTVREAAAAFGMDMEVLMGVGAAESSFYPRDSADGGRGLFQITAPPATATAAARVRLGTDHLDPLNQRHNAFVAAATLQHYLGDMHGDLFLGLLAYNIGPRNGGLRSIMQQYGARDFITIQPYLQHLPRDYPIRVLCAALAYRVWHAQGGLPRYEEGDNALRIQSVGIPGLRGGASFRAAAR